MTRQAARRELVHTRQIDLRFYARDDGRFEVEGALMDTKSHPFLRQLADEEMPPGTPLHDIVVTLVIDEDMRVHDARAQMRATPFEVCQGAQQTLAPLVGLSMRSGWNRRVRELLGGKASCTHIVELLGPMATTAYQGEAPRRLAAINDPANEAQKTSQGRQLPCLRGRGASGRAAVAAPAPARSILASAGQRQRATCLTRRQT